MPIGIQQSAVGNRITLLASQRVRLDIHKEDEFWQEQDNMKCSS
jgi:hypothetical protein